MKKAIIKSSMRLKNGIIIFLLSLFTYSALYGQKNDYIWQLGNADVFLKPDPTNWSTPFQFNFNHDPMRLEYLPTREWDFTETNSTYCNAEGELQTYSNGMFIVNKDHQWMQGGEVIGYNNYWESRKVKLGNGKFWYAGFSFPQGNLILPYASHPSQLVHIATSYDLMIGNCTALLFSIIDLNKNNGLGEVILRDSLMLMTTLKEGGLAATRHANGRDWWIIVESDDNSKYFIFSLTPYGIKLHNSKSGIKKLNGISRGTNAFSLQGDRYVSNSALIWDLRSQITLFDFDRATGLLSNVRYDSIPVQQANLGVGVIFSPDGRYLYANNREEVYKYDLTDNNFPDDKTLIAEYDGFVSYDSGDPDDPIQTTFGYWQYGPDGKLYNVSGFGRARHMHRIDNPDEAGQDCDLRQHALYTPNNPRSIPNFPNFRLGPLDGSPADTLGLDNNPVAKYRYEADTLDHLKVRFTDLSYFRPEQWTWDFGDGTTFEGRKPYWHTFPKNGTYNVCLTVSNENSSNTSCRLVTIGTNAADEVLPQKDIVSIFPNSVETEMLLTISEYIPEHGVVELFDMMGIEVLKQRVYYGWNNVDLTNLINGTYYYKVKDKGRQIHSGQFIKIAK